jgi:signal transduction histidine kinase
MVFLGVLPTLLFAIIALLNYANSEREEAAHRLMGNAKGVARAIDMEFEVAIAALTALKSSSLLEQGDLVAFEHRLRNTKLTRGRGFVLLDEAGDSIINASKLSASDIRRVQSQRTGADRELSISNVIKSDGGHEPFVFIAIPVPHPDGVGRWILGTFLDSRDFAEVVNEPGVPDDWIVSIVDRDGTHIRRSHLNSEYTGQPLVPELVRHIESRGTGTLLTISHEGLDLISTVAYARTSGWAAAVGLPLAKLEAPLWQSLRTLAFIGTALVVTALVLAFWVAGTLTRAFGALKRSAETLGRGEIVEPSASVIQEANVVIATMADVSHQLAERRAELTALNDSLEAQVAERTAELVQQMAIREEKETQLRQLYKLDAIGKLTGGIAHDFNNMLAVVMSGLNLAKRRLDRGDTDIQKFLDGSLKGAENAASLTRRLLAFSRQQALSPESVDCNKLITNTASMLRRTLPENIEIETVLGGGLWRSHADVPGLENAILNLALNARDAMPSGGKLTIETSNTHLDDAYASDHADVAAGQYVMIALTDTGIGIPADILADVYEPFFTTKAPGEGTGLGLSQVHGFIKQSNGHIKIYSEIDRGTIVKLYLPRQLTESTPAYTPARTGARVPKSQSNETILVVEDDADVRAATVAMLQELEYTVLEASGGVAGLEILDAHPEIALLMTDVVMPGMDGRQLATAATERRPDLRVLFTTGYTRNAIVHHGVLDPDVSMIGKPYTLEALSQKVSEVLSS